MNYIFTVIELIYSKLSELYLDSRDKLYGPGYQSGQIRIAFTAGNDDAANSLFGGCILGNSSEARKFGIRKTRKDESWCNGFHVYTARWTNGTENCIYITFLNICCDSQHSSDVVVLCLCDFVSCHICDACSQVALCLLRKNKIAWKKRVVTSRTA